VIGGPFSLQNAKYFPRAGAFWTNIHI
jgi:hypothetical protein